MSESGKIDWIGAEGEPLRRWWSLPVFKQIKLSADAIPKIDTCLSHFLVRIKTKTHTRRLIKPTGAALRISEGDPMPRPQTDRVAMRDSAAMADADPPKPLCYCSYGQIPLGGPSVHRLCRATGIRRSAHLARDDMRFSRYTDMGVVLASYRRRASELYPHKSGTHEAMAELNAALAVAGG